MNAAKTELRAWFVRGVFAAWLLGTGFLMWLMLAYPNRKASDVYKDYVIELPPRVSLEELGVRLEREGAIEHPLAFRAFMRLMGADQHLRGSFLVLNRGLSLRALLPRIASGFGASSVRVPVPEGFTRFDLATRMERFGVASRAALLAAGSAPSLLLQLGIPGDSVEGYLFPATYTFTQGSPAADVLKRMVDVFRKRTTALFTDYARAHGDAPEALSAHQVLILASIVEREARVPDERPLIAGVFMNRLTSATFKPRRLQADPTVAYGCLVAGDRVPSCLEYDGRRITPGMLRDASNPYSTYRRDGLPPGPICSPGLDAIKAALAPQVHDYFYFVTKGGGRHAFSHSLDEHNQRVRESP